jgi:UPF0755 protein
LSARTGSSRVLTLGTLALSLLAVTLLSWLLLVYPNARCVGTGTASPLVIERGATVDDVIGELEARGVIERPWLFAIYLRVIGAGDDLREGPVHLRSGMTARDALRQLAKGFGPARIRVTVPEGYTTFDIGERLTELGVCSGDEFLIATGDRALLDELGIGAASAEGYLFPDTYELEPDAEPEAVVTMMIRTRQRRVAPLFESHRQRLAHLADELGWSAHDVLILASIVEKEVRAAEERPRVAGVFINRLRSPTFRPKRLQADPTVSYGCRADPDVSAACRAFDGRITRAMLSDTDNPYNTYRFEGLPPGPISNPGLDAIRAVLEYEEHDFLYFVARGGGRHHFSATLGEHHDATERYQQ